jgi:hypothetical protein
MGSSTVRISKESSAILKEIAAQERKTLQSILDDAIENYRRNRFLHEVNKAYSALRKNPKAWEAEREERKQWDAALPDGQGDRGND